jgi:uncharacterized membrane protein YciS (DUF1049 family)
MMQRRIKMSAIACPQDVAVTSKFNRRRALQLAALAYIATCVLISIVGLFAKLPDLPQTHAHTDKLAISQVLVGNGTIMSPPLMFMIAFGVLLWAATLSRVWIARVTTVILMLVVASAIDETEGFNDKPTLYSIGKWHLSLALGTVFDIVALAVIITGILWFRRNVVAV